MLDRRRLGGALACCGLLAGCESAPVKPAEADGGTEIIVDTAAMASQSKPYSASWLAYGLMRANTYQKLKAVRKNQAGDDYAIELAARKVLADTWRQLRADDASSDPYLDALVAFDDQ